MLPRRNPLNNYLSEKVAKEVPDLSSTHERTKVSPGRSKAGCYKFWHRLLQNISDRIQQRPVRLILETFQSVVCTTINAFLKNILLEELS